MSAGGGDNSNEVDLNLAPIIDCFTVLITYLLVSASFISITVMDVGVAASGTAAPSTTTTPAPENKSGPPLTLIGELTLDKRLELKLSGGPEKLDQKFTIAPSPKREWDTDAITTKVEGLKKRYPAIKDITLTAEASVEYKDVVKVIEKVKKVLPKVFLGGS